MPNPKTSRPIPRPIRTALAGLRTRIRSHIVLEGIASIVIWLGLTFWLCLGLDYLPVKLGLSELPYLIRFALLAVVTATAVYLFYRMVLRRLFVKMRDRSMALLLERKFEAFEESLITTVEAADSSHHQFDADFEMLDKTQDQALQVINEVDTRSVLDQKSLQQKLVVAGLLALTILVFAFARPASFQLATNRLYLLDSRTWPRECHIEVVGIKVKRDNLIEGIVEFGQVVSASENEFRVSKGSSLTLLVRAEYDDDSDSKKSGLPDSCSLSYRTNDGTRGNQKLKKVGAPRDGYQLYSLDGQPFNGILTDLNFSIRGGDHRIGPFKVTAVDAPSVVKTELDCVFPGYMVDMASMRWTPRTIEWSGHSQLPQGTKLVVKSLTNKPLKKVYALDTSTKKMTEVLTEGRQFSFPIDQLVEPANFQFYLCDTDNIVSEEPHSVSIQPIEDQPPIVQTRLDGIGTAVTPDVRIPITGNVEDDYGVARQWVTISTPVAVPLDESFSTVDGKIDTEIDFRRRRQRSQASVDLPTDSESQLEIVVQAEDKFNLRDKPNVGLGDRYVLDIVTPGELLRILERLEVGHRRRLEQIYSEVTDARGYLVRSKSQRDVTMINEPGENAADAEDDTDPIRRDEMRLLFAQRAALQIDKSFEETLGLAIEFDSIRKQLINNRVDSKDRIARLSDQIVKPLQLIANDSMQQLTNAISAQEESLVELQKNSIDRNLSRSADEQAIESLEQIDVVLEELDQVLSILVKYETQNELLDIVRQMIKQQKEINERTSKENKRKAFDRLLDLD